VLLLETNRLILRRWKSQDLGPFRKLNADPRVMEFYPETLLHEQSDKLVEAAERHFEQQGYGLFAAQLKESEELIGFVGLQNVPFKAHFTPAIELGYRIAYEHWNKGYATEAGQAVLTFAFSNLGLSEVVAMTYKHNLRSRRVMEKLNMTYDPNDDFDNPHPKLCNTWLVPHVLFRIKKFA